MFDPYMKHPHTLAFINLVQANGSIFPIGEMQSRYFALLLAKKVNLPNIETMIKDIETHRKFTDRFYDSKRHKLEVNWIPFMDELAIEIGVKPDLVKLFYKDPILWWNLFWGPCLPYQYRLDGID